MSNRIDATSRGVGCQNEVYQHGIDSLKQLGESTSCIEGLKAILDANFGGDMSRNYCLALICSYLNRDFVTSGRLFSVRDSGSLTYDYITSEETRKTMAALMNS